MGILPLCRDAVCVFCSPCWLGWTSVEQCRQTEPYNRSWLNLFLCQINILSRVKLLCDMKEQWWCHFTNTWMAELCRISSVVFITHFISKRCHFNIHSQILFLKLELVKKIGLILDISMCSHILHDFRFISERLIIFFTLAGTFIGCDHIFYRIRIKIFRLLGVSFL